MVGGCDAALLSGVHLDDGIEFLPRSAESGLENGKQLGLGAGGCDGQSLPRRRLRAAQPCPGGFQRRLLTEPALVAEQQGLGRAGRVWCWPCRGRWGPRLSSGPISTPEWAFPEAITANSPV